jgi:uncharacterized protein (DUF2345 family)
MLQDLAALTPPAIVCVAVLVGTWALVRRELAPKRRQRAEAAVAADTVAADTVAADTVAADTVAADEDRAVDPEHGRSLYFPTSAIYLAGAAGTVLRAAAHLSVAAEVHAVRLRT